MGGGHANRKRLTMRDPQAAIRRQGLIAPLRADLNLIEVGNSKFTGTQIAGDTDQPFSAGRLSKLQINELS